ncbi:unnamed protein product [Urochloa humidicola]
MPIRKKCDNSFVHNKLMVRVRARAYMLLIWQGLRVGNLANDHENCYHKINFPVCTSSLELDCVICRDGECVIAGDDPNQGRVPRKEC